MPEAGVGAIEQHLALLQRRGRPRRATRQPLPAAARYLSSREADLVAGHCPLRVHASDLLTPTNRPGRISAEQSSRTDHYQGEEGTALERQR